MLRGTNSRFYDDLGAVIGFLYDYLWLVIAAVVIAMIISGRTSQVYTGGRKRGRGSHANDRVKDLTKHPRTKSEALAIDILEKLTGERFPTVNPDWLRVVENGRSHTIELDGYNADVGIALEFSGPLHTKWTPSIEPYASYLRRVKLDQAKIELCTRQGVCLVVIDMTLPRTHWRNYIASRLQDCGKLPVGRAIYFQYIPQQTAVVYRDDILERDISLDLTW